MVRGGEWRVVAVKWLCVSGGTGGGHYFVDGICGMVCVGGVSSVGVGIFDSGCSSSGGRSWVR